MKKVLTWKNGPSVRAVADFLTGDVYPVGEMVCVGIKPVDDPKDAGVVAWVHRLATDFASPDVRFEGPGGRLYTITL